MPYYVYLLADRKRGALYAGVTNDLVRRLHAHKVRMLPGIPSEYGIDRLVWFEAHEALRAASRRRNEIRKWRRDWKAALIESANPDWRDLWGAIMR